ncbi:DUF2207 family protein [Kineococcus sp. SYSU DK004]|uniref:DUF2207 family protein n=1 Tax=Kineococcus sp. SYSU DK004 TaxID=3383125 RepID=UPI003D7CF35E
MTGAAVRWAAAAAVAVLALLGPLAASAAAEEPAEGERVRSYRAELTVTDDGGLRVRETIAYDFGDAQRHGLLRTIPVRGPHEQTRDRRWPVSDVAVSSPTGAPTQVQQETDGGVLELRIGDPDREDVTGQQTWVLDYRVDAVVDDRGEAGQRLVWDALGTGWPVPVDAVEVALSAPVAMTAVRCAVGGEGAATPCEVAGPAAPTASTAFTAAGLGPEQGVTVAADLPAGALDAAPPVLVDTFSPARAFRADAGTLGGSAAVLAAGTAGVLALRRRHREPAAVLGTGASVAGVPPGVLGALVHGGARPLDVTATLLDLAQRGHLEVERVDPGGDADEGDEGDWLLRRTGTDLAPGERTTPAEERLLHTLFRGGPDTTLSALRTEGRAGVQLTQQALDDDVVARGWFTARPARLAARWAGWSLALLLGGLALTVVLALTSTWALAGLAVAAVGLLALLATVGLSALTPDGRAARDAARAFAADLARAGEGPGADPARFARHLPHALALEAADRWEEGARSLDEAQRPVPAPTWFRAPGAPAPGFFAPGRPGWTASVYGGLLGGFSSDATGALAAPPPSTSSSSSTSSVRVGGGAGGGGGGSW